MDTTTTKVVAMVLLGAISLAVGMLPTALMRCMASSAPTAAAEETGDAVAANRRRRKRARRGRTVVSCLSCFAGGVILTTCFTHMMPHVVQDVRHQKGDGLFPETGLNLAEIFILCGFFLIYAVEEFTHLVLKKCSTEKAGRNKPYRLNAIETFEDKPMFRLKPMGEETTLESDSDQSMSKSADSENESFQASLRGFLVVLALSLHAVFEGMALGLAPDTASVWFLFFAISSHKYIITFCVGTQLASSGVRPLLTAAYVATLALVSPIGAGIGLGLTESAEHVSTQAAVITVFQGIATGTLMYVVFFEIIEKERAKGTSGVLIVTCLVLGFLCILTLQLSGGGESGHSHGSAQSHHDSDEHGNPLVCLLEFVDEEWVTPMHFACNPETKVLSPLDGSEEAARTH